MIPHLQVRTGGVLFVYRAGAVALDGGRVLIHRAEGDEFWALPGGRVQAGETAREALVREIHEEIGTPAGVAGRLLFIVENFFEHWPLDRGPDGGEKISHHELGLYFEVGLPDDVTAIPSFSGVEEGGARPLRLEFEWVPLDALPAVDMRPVVLRDALAAEVPVAPRLLVSRD